MSITALSNGESITITGDGERIVWTKEHNGKYAEVTRKHTTADGTVKELSEPCGINGFTKADEELDFRIQALGWEIEKE